MSKVIKINKAFNLLKKRFILLVFLNDFHSGQGSRFYRASCMVIKSLKRAGVYPEGHQYDAVEHRARQSKFYETLESGGFDGLDYDVARTLKGRS